jgi:hypothetical protein
MTEFCDLCRKEETQEEKLSICSRCKSRTYCSKECQVNHWKSVHKNECKGLSQQRESRLAQNTSSSEVADATASSAYATAERMFKGRMGGCIFVDNLTGKAIAIEFDGPARDGIKVEYVLAPTTQQAEMFLRGETFETMPISPSTLQCLHQHLSTGCRSKNLTDVGSGCLMYSGTFKRL